METICREQYLDKLKTLKDKKIIKVLTGIRRSGKSTILNEFKKYLLKEGVPERNIISINFDDINYNELLDATKLHQYILDNSNEKEKNYVFLDEIHNVKNFEKCVDSLFLRDYLDIYMTGSNSYMLSGELATYLTGRYIQIHVLPLSFKEYLSYYGEVDELRKYDKYIQNGGFPYLLNLSEDKDLIRNYLDGIYNTVLMKDVVSRNNIKDTMILESVIKFLFDNIGQLVSTHKISNTLNSNNRKNSVNTIENYLSNLLDSYIVYKISRYDIKGKDYLKTGDKYYVCDLGLRNYLLGEVRDYGSILENIIFLELKRRGYDIYVGKYDDKEVDFVVKNKDGIKYIQVALSVRDEKTLERELSSLNVINDHYPKYLITLDYDTSVYNGIRQISAYDFLSGRVDL